MGRGKLKVIALVRVRDAAPREERPAYERRAAAVLLQHAVIDMVGEEEVYLRAVDVEYFFYLVARCDGEGLFPRRALGGERIERDGERTAEQPRQARGESVARRYYAYLAGGERIAVHQHAVALRHGVAPAVGLLLAQLRLGFG